TLQNNLPVGFDTYTRLAATVVAQQGITVIAPATLTASSSAADPLPYGDMDLDGNADVNDVGAFALALTDAVAYEAAFGVRPAGQGDFDRDGDLDFADLPGLVAALAEPIASRGAAGPAERVGISGTDILFAQLGQDRSDRKRTDHGQLDRGRAGRFAEQAGRTIDSVLPADQAPPTGSVFTGLQAAKRLRSRHAARYDRTSPHLRHLSPSLVDVALQETLPRHLDAALSASSSKHHEKE
ncbi:MAG: hypothetical protein ACC645_24740, partial [Pirellulales bacterium]